MLYLIRSWKIKILPLALFVFSLPALSQSTVTQPLSVSATVVAQCNISNVAPVAFGNYDPSSTVARDAQGSFTVTCSPISSVTINLDPGLAFATGFRRMQSTPAGSFLNYQLYQETGRTTIFGSSAGGLARTADFSTTQIQNFQVFGRIPAQQTVQPGNYTDTVQIQVTF